MFYCDYHNGSNLLWLSGKSNIQVVTGLSGHGFKFASVLGEIITQRAQRQQIHFDLSPFSLQRFD